MTKRDLKPYVGLSLDAALAAAAKAGLAVNVQYDKATLPKRRPRRNQIEIVVRDDHVVSVH